MKTLISDFTEFELQSIHHEMIIYHDLHREASQLLAERIADQYDINLSSIKLINDGGCPSPLLSSDCNDIRLMLKRRKEIIAKLAFLKPSVIAKRYGTSARLVQSIYRHRSLR